MTSSGFQFENSLVLFLNASHQIGDDTNIIHCRRRFAPFVIPRNIAPYQMSQFGGLMPYILSHETALTLPFGFVYR